MYMSIEKERILWNILQSIVQNERTTGKIDLERTIKYHEESRLKRIHEV